MTMIAYHVHDNDWFLHAPLPPIDGKSSTVRWCATCQEYRPLDFPSVGSGGPMAATVDKVVRRANQSFNEFDAAIRRACKNAEKEWLDHMRRFAGRTETQAQVTERHIRQELGL